MKRTLLSASLLFGAITAFSQSQNLSESGLPKFIRETKQIAEMEKKENEWKLGNMRSAVGDNYNLIYNRCQWHVDPNVNYISGAVTSYFKPTASGFSQIDFDLSDNMSVDSVKYHSSALSYSQASDVLSIYLPSSISQGVKDSVTVYYQGAPVATDLGSFVQSTHNGTPIIWTLSEPFGARDWWPCKQSLQDKIDSIDIYVTCPQAYRDGSNGVLVSEVQSGINKIYHWKSRYPMAAYSVAIAVTNYSQYTEYATMSNGASLPIVNYVFPEDLTTAQSSTPAIIDVLELFGSLTIDYPFKNEKYGHCEFGYPGGMEHQTMSYTGVFDEWLTAHECAHQWFGNKITCGSWQDVWLNEGFATYFEGLTHQYLYPSEWEDWKYNVRYYVVSEPDGSVMCSDTTDVDRIFDPRLSYCKGACVLHMLRWELGDANFFQGIKDYLNDAAFAYGYAKTTDLKHHLETAGGVSLTTFFNQWYYNEGYPSYDITWSVDGGTVVINLGQTQSDPSVSFFRMHVPIELKNATHDTIVVLNNTSSGQQFTVHLSFTPDQLILDPDSWILHANDQVSSPMYLPVGILNFTAKKTTDARVELDWTSASEIYGSFFTIEKSNVETNFEMLDTVDVTGNSITPSSYIFYDEHPANGTNYYRLKQTDNNGTSNYSPVVNVAFSNNSSFFIYPNPVDDDLNIVTNEPIKKVQILDVAGRVVYEHNEDFSNQIKINLSGISPGCYLLKTINNAGDEKSQMLVKDGKQ